MQLSLGGMYGTALLLLVALAAILSPVAVFLPGLSLAALQTALWMGTQETRRFMALLGKDIAWSSPTATGTRYEQWRDLASAPRTMRLVRYALIRWPLALLELGILTVLFTWPAVMLAAAARSAVTGNHPSWGPFTRTDGVPLVAIGSAILLVAVLTVAGPAAIRTLTALDLRITRTLLAPGEATSDRIGELVESRARVQDAADAERARIERDLHDGVQQQLIALGASLGRAESRLRRHDPDGDALALVSRAKTDAMEVVADIRALTSGLRPPILTSRGLDAALSAVAARLEIRATITAALPRLPAVVEAVLYFALTECLTNAAKHAPGAQVRVTVELADQEVRAEVLDDGTGGAHLGRGSGLRGIADRLSGVDGRLWVSSPAGGPTLVRIEVPCAL